MLYLTSDILAAYRENVEEPNLSRLAFLGELIGEGTEILVPSSNELTLDYDPKQVEALGSFRVINDHIMDICDTFDLPLLDIEIRPSNTLGHYHGIVKLHTEVQPIEKRVALQLLMGSDPVREKMTLLRAQCNVDFPCVLFKHSKPKYNIAVLQTTEY